MQISSTLLVVGKTRRNEATAELIKTSPALIQFLVRAFFLLSEQVVKLSTKINHKSFPVPK